MAPVAAAGSEGAFFLPGVPGWRGCVCITQGFAQDAAVDFRADLEIEQVAERRADVDVADWRQVAEAAAEAPAARLVAEIAAGAAIYSCAVWMIARSNCDELLRAVRLAVTTS